MTIKELQEALNQHDPDTKILVSSDEELNTVYEQFGLAVYGTDGEGKPEAVVIFGYGKPLPDEVYQE